MTVSLKIHIEPLPEGMWADGKRVDAFEEMYRRCYPQLVDVCRRNLCGRGDPEALAQEAFVRAWKSLDRFSGVRPFWPWVATIARRLCIDYRRRLDREALNLHVAAALQVGTTESPDELVENDEEGKSVVLALSRLKPSEQRVIALRDLNGWSYDEIARFEGVTVESIRGSLKRARASLRRSYAKVAAGAPAVLAGRAFRPIRDRLARRAGSPAFLATAGYGADAVVRVAAVVLTLVGPVTLVSSAGGHASVPVGSVVAPPPPTEAPDGAGAFSVPESGLSTGASAPDPAASEGGNGPSYGPLVLPPDGASRPEDTVVTDITPSPSYADDRTLFAVGTVGSGCAYGPCAALFRSGDAGGSWSRLPAEGFTGGTLLLPPSFPADSRMFAAGPTGLQVSTDGGRSFALLLPLAGDATISPGFSTGDPRILIGQAPLWEYRDDDVDSTRPSTVIAPSTSGSLVPLFSPRYADDLTLFVGGTATDGMGRQQSVVFRCVSGVCTRVAVLDDAVGPPALAVSADGTGILAWRGEVAYASRDAGRTFTEVALPLSGAVRDAAFDPAGRLLVGIRAGTGGRARGGLVTSADGGLSWTSVGAGTALAGGVEAVVAPTARQIVAALAGTEKGGVLCSTDGGLTWERRCAA